jgi:hypothetical protein
MSITNAASPQAARIFNFYVNGSSILNGDLLGNINMVDGSAIGIGASPGLEAIGVMQPNANGRLEFISNNNTTFNIFNQSLVLSNNTRLGWGNDSAHNTTTVDTGLTRLSAGVLGVGTEHREVLRAP